MIIFDLDGTLANCEHRRKFVDPKKNPDYLENVYYSEGDLHRKYYHKYTKELWKQNWDAFYEACDKDQVIKPIKSVLIQYCHRDIQIWSGRCESMRKKTENWISYNILDENVQRFKNIKLKLRPIGDTTPEYELKEGWLNERCSDMIQHVFEGKPEAIKHDIDFVFESDPRSIEMWRRRGIFVFDCNQTGEEF